MAYPTWQPGALYQPGDIVIPITAPAPSASALVNGDFSAGAAGWDFTGGAFYTTSRVSPSGFKMAVELPGRSPTGEALNQTRLVVPVGKKITATCQIDQGPSVKGASGGWVEVHWFNSADVLLRVDKGNFVDDGAKGAVHPSTCESIAPAGAAYCRCGIALWSVADHSHSTWGGALSVQGTFAGLPADLAYKAVQPESGFSDSSEPAWPPVLGQRVDDNEVTWEAISATRVIWTAEPLYVSGDEEPEWPEDEGAMIKSGTVLFRAVSRRVEDPNCPNTAIVAIAASKVFCADDDIVRYSATVNPLDWSTADDAGYLPTGLQNYGSNPTEAMGLYRGNLIVFNAEAFQLWQVDEDPASMALLDALPMGSTQHHAIAPVSNDLFFLASQGVRSVGIAASSTNFQAGDVGMPIDPLVRDAVTADSQPLALYYPAMGQYWLAFPRRSTGAIALNGDVPDGAVGDSGSVDYVVSGGVRPYGAVVILSGELPPGASMSAAGVVDYVYTTPGSYSWVVGVVDSQGNSATLHDSAVVSSYGVILSGRRGGGGVIEIKSSPDGIVGWDAPPIYVQSPGDELAGNEFLGNAAGKVIAWAPGSGSSTRPSYSVDGGRSWRFSARDANSSLGFNIIEFGGSILIHGQSRNLAISTDGGVSFQNQNIYPHYIGCVSKTSRSAIAVNGSALTRTDDSGRTWYSIGVFSALDTVSCAGVGDGTYMYFGGSKSGKPALCRKTLTGPFEPIPLPEFAAGSRVWNIASSAGIAVIVTDTGEIAFDNGNGFALASSSLGRTPMGLVYTGGVFVVAGNSTGENGGVIKWSVDCDTWVTADLSPPMSIKGIALVPLS